MIIRGLADVEADDYILTHLIKEVSKVFVDLEPEGRQMVSIEHGTERMGITARGIRTTALSMFHFPKDSYACGGGPQHLLFLRH